MTTSPALAIAAAALAIAAGGYTAAAGTGTDPYPGWDDLGAGPTESWIDGGTIVVHLDEPPAPTVAAIDRAARRAIACYRRHGLKPPRLERRYARTTSTAYLRWALDHWQRVLLSCRIDAAADEFARVLPRH